MTKTLISGIALALCLSTSAFAAGEEGENVTINPPEAVSLEDGLAAWDRVYEVASHPRCANCHVGNDNIPMWSGPTYGTARPHGMNINAGESRIGAETLMFQPAILPQAILTPPSMPPRAMALTGRSPRLNSFATGKLRCRSAPR